MRKGGAKKEWGEVETILVLLLSDYFCEWAWAGGLLTELVAMKWPLLSGIRLGVDVEGVEQKTWGTFAFVIATRR
jgi:hypothetical protein